MQNETQLWQEDGLPSYLPICDPFMVYIIRINQLECSPLLSHKRDQPISVYHFWVTIPICNLIITYLWHTCDIFVTDYTCDVFVTDLWPTCDWPVIHLWLTCDPLVALLLHTSNCIHMKPSWKLRDIFFKVEWIFSDISEQNNDYSDTLDFRRGGWGWSRFSFCRSLITWLRIRNVNILYIYIYIYIYLRAFDAPRGSAQYYDSQLRSSLRSLLAHRAFGTPKDNGVDASIDYFSSLLLNIT